jgi:hypothetical protein
MPQHIGSIQECLWKIALADKKINEVNINVMEKKTSSKEGSNPFPTRSILIYLPKNSSFPRWKHLKQILLFA